MSDHEDSAIRRGNEHRIRELKADTHSATRAFGTLSECMAVPLQEWFDAEQAAGAAPSDLIAALTRQYANALSSVLTAIAPAPEAEAALMDWASDYLRQIVPELTEAGRARRQKLRGAH